MSPIPRRMPAEWEPHQATWIAWPYLEEDWPGKLSAVNWVYTEIVRVLSESERVEILCHNEEIRAHAAELLALTHVPVERFRLHVVPNNRSWLRDSAPTAVRSADGSLEWIAWQFNAWAKYDNYLLDQKVPEAISNISEIPHTPALRSDNTEALVMEGGVFDTDGEGTLLVTEECLLSEVQLRNKGFSKADYESAFAKYLGISKTIWLGKGCIGDDTHGHVDDIARFVGAGVVVVAEDEADPNYPALFENYERLMQATDANGRKLKVVPLPMPRLISLGGDVLPASYAKFYIANTTVLVPTFNDPADSRAIAILSELFPDRKVVGIHSVDLVLGQGTLHCLTQQQPA